jgi:hypothetical protein
MATLSLDAFKDALKNNAAMLDGILGTSDTIDFDNGSAIIHRSHINAYLEKYLCKSEEDLEDTLWYNYGVFVKIID